ncbi:purine and uridine phosphorylase [Trematosphaeria pertusa]|uniref:Purine and uridine phosphorylase n=1 Tax=Trematosphaeria pertusa TaxID=390896 RepID=A0A6A6I2F9_9PLEO|nr:purine and uridine phosphorylase [Trematosphaeria pertusa]KAF2244152.1 purine and uridine phosphorylase [Trematosphaeria pertusa]
MPDVHNYTVGFVCALTTEAVALRSFFDEQHEPPVIPSLHGSSQDNNVYTTGKMESHNVVVASLPQGKYGISPATSVIGDMVRSFPNLRCCLMVGIGGGAPSKNHDIRLGDIVVSAPVGRTGGVLQYDHGKAIQHQPFKITQHLNEPPSFLLSAVGKLAQDYELEGHQLQDMVGGVLTKYKRLARKYRRPAATTDRLYVPNFVHPGPSGCSALFVDDASTIVQRAARNEDVDDPAVHYGIIATGSSLMKVATVRDKLAEEEDVLCFEMEAAGLMNRFPCLVIRGICNYSDSHRNDDRHGYAAIMAAAYAKEILRVLPPSKVAAVEKISKMLRI